MSYESDRAWSDRCLPHVTAIVGQRLLVPAPIERDRNEATDLIVLHGRNVTIAVRLRRAAKYLGKYPGQFTIRSDRESGAKTELAKIIDGWGDWLFYGYGTDAGDIPEWMLVDLTIFRAAVLYQPQLIARPTPPVSGRQSNHDGTHFAWFHAPSLWPRVLIAASDERRAA